MRAVILVGSDLWRRGWLAVSPERTADGAPVNAIYASARAIQRVLAMKPPERAIAFFANELDGPAALQEQHDGVIALVQAYGFAVERVDDPVRAAASACRRARSDGCDVVVAGYDKRLNQLVEEGQVWFYDAYKDVRYTPETVAKRFGVGPAHVAEWLALVGDDSACPGLRGIGAKGATTLLEAYGSVDEALARLDAIKGRTGNALRAAGAGVARRAVTEAVLADPPRETALPAWERPDEARLDALFRRYGFVELLSAQASAGPDVQVCPTPVDAAALVLGSAPVALFPLFDGPSPVRGTLVGLGLSRGDGDAVYVPRDALSGLRDWLADPAAEKLAHDVKAVSVLLAGCGLTVEGLVGDASLASHQLDPSGSAPHELGPLARVHAHRILPSEDRVLGRGKKRKAWCDVPQRAAAFAGARAEAAGAIWRALAPSLDPVLYAEQRALVDVLERMERKGMPVDRDVLAETGRFYDARNEALQARIFEWVGHPFGINSTKQLGEVLFGELELPVVARTKTGWSTSNAVLERLIDAHPGVPLVMQWRTQRRLRDMWVTALATHIDPDGRVRSTFHAARSFTGRILNAAPDLGRTPGSTPELARIRRAFVAPPGWSILSLDYDQLGLYVWAHLTGDPALVDPLARGDDMHAATARAVLDKEAVSPEERQIGKVVNFATFADQGASALALQLGVDATEAKALIARFDERYAVTRAYQAAQLEHARTQGWVPTLAGRRWPMSGLASRDPQMLGFAERLSRRAAHEGSVADVVRRGLLLADRAIREAGLRAFPLIQILDEVVFEVPHDEVSTVVAVAGEAMRSAFDLRVPLRVGAKAGPTWGDLQPLALH
jgi:DNA polymerase-1